ncbi:MAG: hypothetical protein KAI73_02380 [Rhodospirillaceae bacterium]|nr:hypothetical protein [Rhodospirillaceae bacterium]
MALVLENDIIDSGMWQADLVKFLNNVLDIVNELQADAATSKTTVDALVALTTELRTDHGTTRTEQIAIGTSLADFKTNFDLHTHTQQDGDGAQTSKADDTAEGVANAGTDVIFTDTSGSPPAAITAPAAAAGPAALTNSTALKLTKG